jgi:hypothetical protein
MTSWSTGITSAIKRKATDQGHRMLGFYLTGDGTSSTHKKVMLEKGVAYAEAINNITLHCGECSIAYVAYCMPSLAYGPSASSLKTKECEDIHQPVVAAILSKMGIVRNAARAVVFGPSQYYGLGLDHLTAVQGHNRVQCLIKHNYTKKH